MRIIRSRTLLKSLASLAAGLMCAAVTYAGTYTNNFSDPTPTGFTFNGGMRADGVTPYPAIENGYMVLTYAENSLQGSVVFDELDPGATVGSFTATFTMRIGGGSSTPADGMAFYLGSDIDSTANFGEEGPTSTAGITVCFDTYDNGSGEAPAIDIKVNGNVVAHKVVDVFYLLSDTFANVVIQLNANGTMNVAYKGQMVYTNQYLEGYMPITGGRFAMGARTGGLNENLWIDDLSITTVVAGAPVVPTISAQNQPQSQTVNERSPVTFAVMPDGTPPFTFQWLSNNVAIADATSRTYTIANVPFTANAAKYTVQVSNSAGSVTSAQATLTVNQDVTAPTIASVSGSETFTLVTVVFSEPVTAASAGASGNYGLSGGLTISSVTVVNPTTVQLTTSPQTSGTVYTLTVNGIQDTASTPNTIAAGSTKDFTAWTLSAGFLKFEVWTGLSTGDNSLDNTLLADPRYPSAPDLVAYTTPFTSRGVYPDDTHEGYGGRMSGWLTPAQDGDYRFFIYSDDSSRLFLSTDATSQNATLIAEETACCNPFTEPESPRTSSPIPLVAGQRYYVEIIWKEGTGGDYALVGWRKEGDPTPASSLAPIPSRFLSAYADPSAASVSITRQPANASTTENKTATFTVAATGSPTPLLYQWQRAAPGSATFADIAGANSATYTTPTLKRALDNGAKYRCAVSVPGKSTSSAEATLTVEIDTTPPSLVRATGGDNLKSVTLVFSEAVEPAKAATPGNYSIPGLTVTGAKVANPTTVYLKTSPQAENTSYTVTVNANVTDTAIPPNPIDPANNAKSFTTPVNFAGVLKWEIYYRINGNAVSDLTSNSRYPDSPDEVLAIVGFDSPNGYTERFGARISGFVRPTESGDYDFFIRSDDASQLFISTDDDPANLSAAPIAQEAGCCNAFLDPGAAQTTAAPIHLEAGQRYYIVALYKEGTGGDYCQVAWRKTDDGTPAGSLTPIASAFVSAAVRPWTLPVTTASPIGSGDASKPGFKARVYEVDQQGSTGTVNKAPRADQELAGAIGPNVADLTGAVDGIFNIDTYINWNQDYATAEYGNFVSASDPSRPDVPIPGIPGTGSNTGANTDNIAGEIITYVEFPAPGIYLMGVNSDDGFKVTATDTPPVHTGAVEVNGPAPAAGLYYAVDGTYVGSFKPFTEVVTGKLVYAEPASGCSALTNPDAIRGNIALIDRGVCEFSTKVKNAKDAGAIAAIVVNSRDPGSSEGVWPIEMGMGAVGYVDIPAVMITKPDGAKIKAGLAAGEVRVTIAPDTAPLLAQYNAGRGAADTLFAVNVAQAGVYPLRCVWFEGGGGANIEWFSVTASGQRILLNDRENASALKTYRARVAAPTAPTLSYTVNQAAGTVTLTYTGVLQSSDNLPGTYTDVVGASSPQTVSMTAAKKFYRARSN